MPVQDSTLPPYPIEASFSRDDLGPMLDRAADVFFRYRLRPGPGLEYVSGAVERVTGFTSDELYADPQSVLRLLHPGDRPVMLEMLRRGPNGNPIVLRWIRKDGSVVWMQQRNVPIFDGAGQLLAIEGIAREVADPTAGSGALVRVVGDLRLERDRRRVIVDGKIVQLTPSEFLLLVLLTDEPGRVVSRETMTKALWGSRHVGESRSCEAHISSLRRKIERDPRRPQRIETVRGEGYRFVAS